MTPLDQKKKRIKEEQKINSIGLFIAILFYGFFSVLFILEKLV